MGVFQGPGRNGGGLAGRWRSPLVGSQGCHGVQEQPGVSGFVVDGVLTQVGLQSGPLHAAEQR